MCVYICCQVACTANSFSVHVAGHVLAHVLVHGAIELILATKTQAKECRLRIRIYTKPLRSGDSVAMTCGAHNRTFSIGGPSQVATCGPTTSRICRRKRRQKTANATEKRMQFTKNKQSLAFMNSCTAARIFRITLSAILAHDLWIRY